MVLQYNSLKDFTDSLDKNKETFPLKIMGEERLGVSYTATMLAKIYNDTPNPDIDTPPWVASFGTINRRGVRLTGVDAYSKSMTPPEHGLNSFQGDIIPHSFDFRNLGFDRKVAYSMVVSHSCDISTSPFVLICPVIFEGEVDGNFIKFIKGKVSKNPKAEIQNMLRNEQHRFLGLPAHEFESFGTTNEPFLVPLTLARPIPTKSLENTTPVLRLTYRANAYLQMRLGVLLMRDVQRSDETRDF